MARAAVGHVGAPAVGTYGDEFGSLRPYGTVARTFGDNLPVTRVDVVLRDPVGIGVGDIGALAVRAYGDPKGRYARGDGRRAERREQAPGANRVLGDIADWPAETSLAT